MKKLLLGLGVLLVVLVAAVLIVPGFIDWNDYKQEARDLVREATGRDLVIGGDITLTVLPAPALSAQDVRLSNAPGASEPDLAALRELEVRIKFAPLLGGHVQVESVRLIEPRIVLERLADGRFNWEFESERTSAATDPAPGAPDAPADDGTAGLGVSLDSFEIVDGSVVYRDQTTGTEEKLTGIDAEIKAASLQGPFEIAGTLTARGTPLTLAASSSRAVHGRTLPFSMTLGLQDDTAAVAVTGTLLNLEADPSVKAKVEASGGRLSTLARRFGGMTGDLPGLLGQPFEAVGSVEASAAGIAAEDITLSLGPLGADGSVAASFGEGTSIDARLAVSRIDLDAVLALAPDRPQTPTPKASQNGSTTSVPVPRPAAQDTSPEPAAPIALPKDVNATVEVTLDALTFRNGLVRQGRLSASLSDGDLTIDQVSAQLPGSSEATLFGFVGLPDGRPRFEGSLEAIVGDLRQVASWLDLPLPSVADDRLRKLALSTQVVATEDEVQLPGLALTLDASKLTGGVTVALRDRPAFGADVTLDRLNLDAYLPQTAPAPPSGTGTTGAGGGGAKAGTASGGAAGLKALSGFDANLKARVQSLTYQGRAVREAVFDGTLYRGALTLRQASVKDLAGASANLSGEIRNLHAVPVLNDLRYDIGTRDATGLFALAGVETPMPPSQLGRVSLVGSADGPVTAPDLTVQAKAADAVLDASGKARILALSPGFKGTVSLRHGDADSLLRRLGADYAPAGRLGALDLSAKVDAGTNSVTLDGLKAALGETTLAGTLAVALDGPRPKLTANLSSGALNLDPLMPAGDARRSDSRRGPGYRPQALATHPAAATQDGGSGAPWSKDPIDLTALSLVDAEVTLKADRVSYQSYLFEAVDLAANLSGGRLDTQKLAARLFGGSLTGRATADASAIDPRFALDLDLARLDIAQALRAAQGSAAGSGQVDLSAKLTSGGTSVDAMVRALNGGGRIALTGVDSKDGAETDLPLIGAVLKLARVLDGAVGGLAKALGGRQGEGLLDAGGTFTVTDGVLTMNDLAMSTAAYDGTTRLTANLPAYTLNADGTLSLSQGLTGQLLSLVKEVPKSIPFSVSGPLDNPTSVKLDTASMPGGKLSLPGKLGKGKTGKVLEQILPGLLGGGSQVPAQAQPPAPPQPAADGTLPPPPPASSGGTQQQTAPKAEDLLRGILQNIK